VLILVAQVDDYGSSGVQGQNTLQCKVFFIVIKFFSRLDKGVACLPLKNPLFQGLA